MNEAQIGRWLAAVGAKRGETSGLWVQAACPLSPWRHQNGTDKNPSFGVRVMPGESRVYCLACGFSGTQYDVLVQLRAHEVDVDFASALEVGEEAEESAGIGGSFDSPGYEEALERKNDEHIYPDWFLDVFEPAYALGVVHPYLEGRRVPYEVAEFLDLRYDPHRRRVLFPVRDSCKRLRGLHGRAIEIPCGGEPWERQLKYKAYPFDGRANLHVWLGEHWADLERPVVIAESVFDLARVLEVYDNVVSPLTASVGTDRLRRLAGVRQVVTLFDEDKAGALARERVAGMRGARVSHVRLPEGTDAADSDPEELARLLAPHVGDTFVL